MATLICPRCGNEFVGVNLERNPLCQYCEADRIRAKNKREEIEQSKAKSGSKGYLFDTIMSQVMCFISMLSFLF